MRMAGLTMVPSVFACSCALQFYFPDFFLRLRDLFFFKWDTHVSNSVKIYGSNSIVSVIGLRSCAESKV